MEEAFNTIYDPKTMEPHSLFSNEGKLLLKALVSSSMSGGSWNKYLVSEGDCCDIFVDPIRRDKCKKTFNFQPKGLFSDKKRDEFVKCRNTASEARVNKERDDTLAMQLGVIDSLGREQLTKYISGIDEGRMGVPDKIKDQILKKARERLALL